MGWIDWDKKPSDPKPGKKDSKEEKADEVPPAKEGTDRSFRVKRYGRMDDVTMEALLVAVFVRDDDSDDDLGRKDRDKDAEVVLSSPIKGNWFRNKFLGSMFDALRDAYREHRSRVSADEASNFIAGGQGQKANESDAFRDEVQECLSARLLNHARAEYLVEEVIQRRRGRLADDLYKGYLKARSDPGIGPGKAVDNFRQSCTRDLVDPSGGDIIETNWVAGYESRMERLRDMKRHPEKYVGFNCGIDEIDEVTRGFRPGHLTVFVGAHGGFKSTMMINVAYGLWVNGYDVLYASLEMEADLMEVKLWCRATRRVSFSKVYAGLMSEPGDWDRIREIEGLVAGEGLREEERKKLHLESERLKTGILGIEKGGDDYTMFGKVHDGFAKAKNKLMIVNAGQSSKVKPSQIERWLDETEGSFKPSVVIIDYLDLVAPETPYPDRRDQELGDICKYFRQMGQQMGFAVITAAQLKRGAIDRMRKQGMDSPEKAQFGTDDIAGSHMIGGDADEVIMLFREDGGNRIRMLVPKARHGVPDIDKGKMLQVDPDTCTIQGSDDIEDTSVRAGNVGVDDGAASYGGTGKPREGPRNPDDDPYERPSMASSMGLDLDEEWDSFHDDLDKALDDKKGKRDDKEKDDEIEI